LNYYKFYFKLDSSKNLFAAETQDIGDCEMQEHNVQTEDPSHIAVVERKYSIAAQLGAALAIIDCIRVLTSLERMSVSENHPDSGEGFANGNCTRDDSMPLALYHAMELIQSAQDHAALMCSGATKDGAA
jgi:hypothetical protein